MQPPDPSVTRIDGPWRHFEVHANGIRFHVVEAESPDAASTRPLVIMLHALRSSALPRRDQGRALLPSLLRYQLPMWPERMLTRNNGAELERLVRSRASGKWIASEDFSETIKHLRQAIRIPSAAHSALEYQ